MEDEKYRLTLEGSDIDEALLRLANYEDEGIVLGSRKGVMLGPESEYYHKNARYYAELAQSAVPGDTTSAVRWDIDQSALTDADREMARKNIRAAGSNPNLFINPFFRINQRGVTSGQGNQGFIADLWEMAYGNGGVIYSRTADTVTIQSANGISHGDIFQILKSDLWNFLNGKTVTLSVMLNDYSIRSATFTFDSTATKRGALQYGLDGNAMSYECNLAIRAVQIWKYYTPETYRAAKLELGPFSTLANDVLPDYGTELRKCMRHFQRIKASQTYCPIGTGLGASATTCYAFVPLPVPMDVFPGISVSEIAQFHIFGENGDKAISSMSVRGISSNGVTLSMTVNGVTTYGTYMLITTNRDAYFDLTANPA